MEIKRLCKSNGKWVKEKSALDPDYFINLSKSRNPLLGKQWQRLIPSMPSLKANLSEVWYLRAFSVKFSRESLTGKPDFANSSGI